MFDMSFGKHQSAFFSFIVSENLLHDAKFTTGVRRHSFVSAQSHFLYDVISACLLLVIACLLLV